MPTRISEPKPPDTAIIELFGVAAATPGELITTVV